MKRTAKVPLPARPRRDEKVDAFRLGPGDLMAFHRIACADETWTLIAGGPVELHLIHPDGRHELRLLSRDAAGTGCTAVAVEAGSLRAARLAPDGRRARLRRRAGIGHPRGSIEVPAADEILRRHPLHRRIILDLTAG